jgi:hypothetical protein
MERNGTQWNAMERIGTQWNAMERNGTPRVQPIVKTQGALYVKLAIRPRRAAEFRSVSR